MTGAHFAINTAQVGGHGRTEAQRILAEEHGYYRGVRLHDFGQMDFMLEVARDVERICPEAWLIQSSNPVFEGCTHMTRETGAKVVYQVNIPNRGHLIPGFPEDLAVAYSGVPHDLRHVGERR